MSRLVCVDAVDDVWTLTLARPEKRNALSAELVEELLDIVRQAGQEAAKVLILRGQGKSFCAGFDFTGCESQSEGDLLLRFVRIELLLQAMAESPCLTVALTHGPTFGAGVDLAAVCRLRIATVDATFRMPGLRFGLVLGTRRFAEIVGLEYARRILQNSATFDATAALEMGFVHQVAEIAQWSSIVDNARAEACVLTDTMRATLYSTLDSGSKDADLSALVRSAAVPGLKARIAEYLNRS